MPSRSIDELLPEVAEKARLLISLCKESEIDLLITCTYRSSEEQAALYAQGRTKPGQIVTNAIPGKSYHEFRSAFDFVPLVNGKAQWDDIPLITKCGEIGESVGLTWAGRWMTFKELLHFQYSEKTLAQLQSEFGGTHAV